MRIVVALVGTVAAALLAFTWGAEIERVRFLGPWNFAGVAGAAIIAGGAVMTLVGGVAVARRRRSTVGLILLGIGLGVLAGFAAGFAWSAMTGA